MNEKELREKAKCGICEMKILKSGLPLFYRVSIQRWGVDANAMERQMGLEMFFGGRNPSPHAVAIAQVMGADEDMATELTEKKEITVCESCAGKPIEVHRLSEIVNGEE